jgi:hypothetical protein
MFSNEIKNNIVAGVVQAFDALSAPATFTSVKTGTARTVQVAVKTVSSQDVAIVNAYGLYARVVTMKVSEFTVPPEKFDTVLLNGDLGVFAGVHLHSVNDVPVFYKGYIKGHNT